MKTHRIAKSARPKTKIGIGYGISDSADAVKTALGLAADLVSEGAALGMNLRSWGIDAREKTHRILKMGERMSEGSDVPLHVQELIAEVLRWEQEISGSIRHYFMQISDLLNHLRMLNPPLNTEQLDPFVEAILTDRRATMAALEPLSSTVQKIATLKTEVWFGHNPTFQQ
jgi:hypothetical protein